MVDFSGHPLYDSNGVFTCADQEELTTCLQQMKIAQTEFAKYTQKQVDSLCESVSRYMEQFFQELAELAHKETNVGNVQDKVIKNIYAGCVVYNSYKDMKTCDVIANDNINGVKKFASPMGIIAGFVPFTNPTATTIYKTMLVLKSRNAVMFSPTLNCQNSSYATLAKLSAAVKEFGGPPGIFGIIRNPQEKLIQPLMRHPLISLIFATGGKGMVNHAYSSGKPSLGVGSGNVPVIIEEEADLTEALGFIQRSKTFDNGVLCSSEEVMLVQASVYDRVKSLITAEGSGFYLIPSRDDVDKVRKTFRDPKGISNMAVIGKDAATIARESGITCPPGTAVLVAELDDSRNHLDTWLHEKMCPALAMIRVRDMDDAFEQAKIILSYNGMGHSVIIHTNQWFSDKQALLNRAGVEMPVGRITVNQPGCFGTIGGLMNFGVGATMSIGCGSWGGNSTSDNIGPQHLVNFKTVSIATEDVRLVRKAVNFFKPELPLVRSAVEMYCVCLEYVNLCRHNGTNLETYADAIECCRIAFDFLDSLATNPGAIITRQSDLCTALEVYHECKFHKEKDLLCSEIRALARSINISNGYFLFIAFPYLLRSSESSGSYWSGLDAIIGTEIGSDSQQIIDAFKKIGEGVKCIDKALPDTQEKYFGLNEHQFTKFQIYKKPAFLNGCLNDMIINISGLRGRLRSSKSFNPKMSFDATLAVRNINTGIQPPILEVNSVLKTFGSRSMDIGSRSLDLSVSIE